jgi:hypothetical protein
MFEERMNPELAAFEATLGGLRPQPATMDRDRVMYRAGQAAAARPRSRWRILAVCSGPVALAANLLLAITLSTLLAAHHKPPIVERIVYVPTSSVAPAALPGEHPLAFRATPDLTTGSDLSQYLKLRREILKHGVDALPEAVSGAANNYEIRTPDSGRRGMLEKLLQG